MNLPQRKRTRLKNYDYSQRGAYFVTICTHHREMLLSHIIVGQGLAPAESKLSEYGKIAEEQLLELENRYSKIKIDKYVIMPNHIHIIIFIKNEKIETNSVITLSDVICAYKSLTTLFCKKKYKVEKVFQNSFHDHVIRDKKDYQRIWEYIDTNPLSWEKDCFYTE